MPPEQEANEPAPALSARQQQAAALIADGALTEGQIAEQLKIGRTTLVRWKRVPAFQAMVSRTRKALAGELVYFAVTDKRHRLSVLQELEDKNLAVVTERGADPSMTDVPGGSTGLLVRSIKVVGTGRDQQVVEEYRRDDVTRDIIAIHDQVRKETGEDKQRLELTGKDGGPIELAAVDLRERMLAELEQVAARLEGGAA